MSNRAPAAKASPQTQTSPDAGPRSFSKKPQQKKKKGKGKW